VTPMNRPRRSFTIHNKKHTSHASPATHDTRCSAPRCSISINITLYRLRTSPLIVSHSILPRRIRSMCAVTEKHSRCRQDGDIPVCTEATTPKAARSQIQNI
jgi:hypothetical protein